jgi:hypothetical protein
MAVSADATVLITRAQFQDVLQLPASLRVVDVTFHQGDLAGWVAVDVADNELTLDPVDGAAAPIELVATYKPVSTAGGDPAVALDRLVLR